MMERKQFYTVKELARELDRSERTVREAILRGDIPACKLCGRWIIGADVLNGLMRRSCESARRIYG